jgi:tRNA pseudouridine38-40 synthase
VKTLTWLSVARAGERSTSSRKRSFLHHQVRNIVGTLRLVGEGKWTREDVRQASARDRTKGGPTAPPRTVSDRREHNPPTRTAE